MNILDRINSCGDIRKISPEEYDDLASEIRSFLIEKVSEHGGHLASNLGAVELTMAIHLAFDPNFDKIIWDVGHQSYTHKILTGRKEGFDSLREFGGMSGFPKRRESQTDVYETGHSTTSISAAIGMAHARDILHQDHHVVAVIGDGSASGGMSWEAFNNADELPSNLVIILNDNNMSISPSLGGFRKHLSNIRTAKGYNDLKDGVKGRLSELPNGQKVIRTVSRTKSRIKNVVMGEVNIFDNLGVTYFGPIDGHNVEGMVHMFRRVKNINHPVIVHVITHKGQGYGPAMRHPEMFHGVSKFDVSTGKTLAPKAISYTDIFSRQICKLAKSHKELVCITAAMREGTGLKKFQKKYPDRFFDVGIAEEHAVTFAAGLAAGGLRPVVAVYSTFLQRAYDQILIDVCLQNLPVIFAIDRAGLVGADGETHQGAFDLSYLSHMPGMTILAPADAEELESALKYAVDNPVGPIAIRYPRGKALTAQRKHADFNRSEIVSDGEDIVILAVGTMLSKAEKAAEIIFDRCGVHPAVVNVRFVKPIDTDMIDELAEKYKLIATYEDNALIGGFGQVVDMYLQDNHPNIRTVNLGLPDKFIEHGNVDRLYKKVGLDEESAADRIAAVYKEL